MGRKDSLSRKRTTWQWPLHKHPVCPALYADAHYIPYTLGVWCVTDTVGSAVGVKQQQTKQDDGQSGCGDDDDGKTYSLFTTLIHGDDMWLIKSGTLGDMKRHMKNFGRDDARLILVPQKDGDKRKFTIDEFNAMYIAPDSPTYTKTSTQLSVALVHVQSKRLVNDIYIH